MVEVSLRPVVSEKSVALAESRTYTFVVPKSAAKTAIARAVAEQFGVKVMSVNTVVRKGKTKQAIVQRGRRRLQGQRATIKHAYVTLMPGESLAIFEGSK